MADVTLQINDPTLTGGQVFKVRYRLLPAGAWVPIADQTNAPFTVTGLSAGDYQLEFIVQLTDETLCAAVYKIVTVTDIVADFQCAEFTVTMSKNPNKLNISYILPMGYVAPPCGYKIKYLLANGTYAYVSYPTLPASPFSINIPSAIAMNVVIVADLCGAGTIECFNDGIAPPAEPTCIPMTITGTTLTPGGQVGNGDYLVTLVINFTQSTPATSVITIVGSQVGVLSGYPPATINWPTGILPSTTHYNGNFYMRYQNGGLPIIAPPYKLKMAGTLIDGCGVSHAWTAEVNL